jgi:hypothetical protein
MSAYIEDNISSRKRKSNKDNIFKINIFVWYIWCGKLWVVLSHFNDYLLYPILNLEGKPQSHSLVVCNIIELKLVRWK